MGSVSDSHLPGPFLGVSVPARQGPTENAAGGVKEGRGARGPGGPAAAGGAHSDQLCRLCRYPSPCLPTRVNSAFCVDLESHVTLGSGVLPLIAHQRPLAMPRPHSEISSAGSSAAQLPGARTF